jgi:hypothetical protein
MANLSTDVVIGQVLAVLREGFEGPALELLHGQGPEACLFGTLGKLDATAASRPSGGTTIAVHIHHLVFSLDASAAWIRGERKSWNWPESWSVTAVDETEWSRLLDQLRGGYRELLHEVEAHAAEGVEAFGGAVDAAAHVAYHLGAIRQKVLVERLRPQATREGVV